MFLFKICYFVLIIYLGYSTLQVAGKIDELTIGAIFHEDEPQIEMAFKYAVARHNMYTQVVKFKTNIQKISPADSFAAWKILCNMTSSGDGLAAIFGPSSKITGAMTQSVCTNANIPHIQIHWNPKISRTVTTTSLNDLIVEDTNNDYSSHGIVLNVHPDPEKFAEGLATIVRSMGWKVYAILYENSDGLLRLKEVLKIVTAESDPIVIRELGKGPDYRQLLKEIKNSTINQIILDCDANKVLEILEQAKEVNLLTMFHSYLITSLDAHTLNFNVLTTQTNITTLRIVDPDSQILHNAVSDWEQGELNEQKFISIAHNKVKTDAALMHDAVNFFTSIVQEIHATDPILTQPYTCAENSKWIDGNRISTHMKVRHMFNAITGPIKIDEEGRRIDFLLQMAEINNGKPELTATWSPAQPNKLNITRSSSQNMRVILETLQKGTVMVSSR